MPKKLDIFEMQRIAEDRGGKCLSKVYVNSKTKLRWQCAIGHQWEAIPDSSKQGKWCRICAGNEKLSIENMHKIAEERGGKCLSEKYVNNKIPLLWQCEKGHMWEARPDSTIRGHWCRKCGSKRGANKKKLDIEEMRRIAEKRGGKCLSIRYTDAHTKLLWECGNGHRWIAKPGMIKHGNWCRKCSGYAKLSIEEMRKIAGERGGRCLSSTYIDNKAPLKWKCSVGHTWPANANSIKSGRWCPECSAGFGERICRAFFEQLFDEKFPVIYPKWLINDRGNRMELDGYSKSLQVAFEHQGSQHYTTSTVFIRTKEKLKYRQLDDKLKKYLCAQRGIVLIHVPEIPARLPIEQVKKFIKKECIKHGVSLPLDFSTRTIDLRKAYSTSGTKEALDRMRMVAKKKGGKCLSDIYVNSKTPLSWQCVKGHRWDTAPQVILKGCWCPKCGLERGAKKKKLGIEEMRRIAQKRRGKCLSKKYINNKLKLRWECAQRHQWEAIPDSVKRGHWCPNCGHKESAIKRRNMTSYS